MAQQKSLRTVDHEEIEQWAAERGGRPVIVKRTKTGRGKSDESGLLRIDFGEKNREFEEVSWDEFFRIFEEQGLAFVYQDETADGGQSRFNKFVRRQDGDEQSMEADWGEEEE